MSQKCCFKLLAKLKKVGVRKNAYFGIKGSSHILSSWALKKQTLLWPYWNFNLPYHTCSICYKYTGTNNYKLNTKQGGSRTTSLAWKYIKECGYSDRFCKNLNQRSLTPRWPLTPHLSRSYVWLYPRIIVSKSHENTSKYVDTVTLFAKTWTKGHWPLDDLWPHICWGHMCDSAQGKLCRSPMGIHQCMWIQWSILQITNQRSFTPRLPLI